MYDWITLLYNRNYHSLVSQLYFNKKNFFKKKKDKDKTPIFMRQTIKKISKIYTLIYMKYCTYKKYIMTVESAKEDI